MPKVCVYAICKNEAQFVDRFMDSAGKADSVVVLDTGSTDDTIAKLQARGATVFSETITPWRFDVARNNCIKLCPKDHILFSLDLDEIIAEPDWRLRFDAAWLPNANRGRYRYVWDHRPDGSDGHSFVYEKIHTHDYEWVLPCHEILARVAGHPGDDYWSSLPMTVRHYPDPVKSRGSYLALLAIAVKEQPLNDRMAHYYGRELFFKGQWYEAIAELTRHTQLPTATWADEKAISMSMIARCYESIKNDVEAERWHFRACAEAIHLREPFVHMGKFYLSRNRFPMAYSIGKRAMEINKGSSSYLSEPYAWNEGPSDIVSTAAYYIGLKPESLACARKAWELAPWDGRLKTNLDIIERMCPELTAAREVPKVVKHENWIEDPKFGLVVSTFSSVPFIHTALEVHKKLNPEVPMLVIDDCSPMKDKLQELCASYGVDFHSNERNLNHTRGDVMSFVTGLRWAAQKGIDVMVKMSRRFVPKQDWRPSLRDTIKKTVHATYSGALDATWGLRTECIALHVDRWMPVTDRLEKHAMEASWLWAERLINDEAIKILPWGTGTHQGAAMWDFPGLGKWVKADTHLWHDTTMSDEYASLAAEYGLSYSARDFDTSTT